MNHLLRTLAPISDAAWEVLDAEARDRLAPALAARRLVDFSGPGGWEESATNVGRVTRLGSAPVDGVSGLQRRVLPLVELRADFELSRDELRDVDRGAADADLGPLDEAAHRIAEAENAAVFHGWQGAFTGIGEASPHAPGRLGGVTTDAYPSQIAGAMEQLLASGIAGPYGLALSPAEYRRVIESTEHAPIPCSTTCARSSKARSSGRRASRERWSRACAAVTSCSTAARTSRSDTTRTTARSSACTCRRASASRSRRPRGRSH